MGWSQRPAANASYGRSGRSNRRRGRRASRPGEACASASGARNRLANYPAFGAEGTASHLIRSPSVMIPTSCPSSRSTGAPETPRSATARAAASSLMSGGEVSRLVDIRSRASRSLLFTAIRAAGGRAGRMTTRRPMGLCQAILRDRCSSTAARRNDCRSAASVGREVRRAAGRMHGQKGLKVTWDDAPLAPEINRPELLQLDPVTDARLRDLNKIGNVLHSQESPRQHHATPVCRLCGMHGAREREMPALR